MLPVDVSQKMPSQNFRAKLRNMGSVWDANLCHRLNFVARPMANFLPPSGNCCAALEIRSM